MKWLTRHWYEPGYQPGLGWRAGAALFRALAGLRRQAYARGWRPVYRAPVPVIVVGNITVGGSGKTPLVIWLVEWLRRQGLTPGVVSRGYGGRARQWPQAVSAASDPALVGDEAVLIAGRCDCPLMVGPKRAEAMARLLAGHGVDVIVSDDGLQHYAMARDVEIVVIDGERRLGNGHCLPAGPLREPPARLETVDFVVNNGGPVRPGEYLMRLDMGAARNLVTGEQRALSAFGPVHALAGIGHPERFFRQLQAQGVALRGRHAFADHHPYTAAELSFGHGEVLMTEKDAVKCRQFGNQHLWAVPVEASLDPAFETALAARLGAIIDARKT